MDLEKRLEEIEKSDRLQSSQLKAIQKLQSFFIITIAIGFLARDERLNDFVPIESLENIAIGIIVSGAGGALGITLPGFKISGQDEDGQAKQ